MKNYIPFALSLTLIPSISLAEPLSKALINGEIFSVNGNADQGIVFSFKGHAFTPDDAAAFGGVHSILEEDGHIYVVATENGGGNASSPQFRIFDVSNPDHPIMSDLMGESISDALVSDWEIKNGAVVGKFQEDDGSYTLECSFKNGKSGIKKIPYAEELQGPVKAPGGDTAIYANEHPILFSFTAKALAIKLKSILPEDVYKEARSIAFETNDAFFSPSHGVVSAKAFKKHDPGEWISIAIDHAGKISAAFSWGGNKGAYYGSPDELTKFAL